MKVSRTQSGSVRRGLPRTRTVVMAAVLSLLATVYAKAEPGAAINYADLTDEKLAWRRNLFKETEMRNGLNDLDTRAGVTLATLAPYANAVQFVTGGDYYAYKQVAPVAGARYWLSVIVRMDDGNAPVFNSPGAADPGNDFVLVVKGDATSPQQYTVTALGGGLYRVACAYTANVSVLGNWGVVKYAGNSTRGFKVTAYQLERSPTLTAYQALTDVGTEFMAAFPLHSLFQDNIGAQPVFGIEQTIGLSLDPRLGGLRGAEVNPDVGFNNPAAWTASGSTPGWVVSNGVAACAQTASANRWINSGATLTVGKWYDIWMDVSVTAGGCLPDISATPVFATTSGRKHWVLQATTTTLAIIAQPAFIGSVDNLSVREVPGQHCIQATAADRPLLDARFNRLIYSEVLTNAAWQKASGVTVVDNTDAGPDGIMLATVTGVAATTCYLQQAGGIPCTPNTTCTMSAYVKAGTAPTTLLRVYNSGVTTQVAGVIVNWAAGVASIGSTLGTWTAGPVIEATTVAGVYRVIGSFSTGTQTALAMLVYPNASNTVDTSKVGGVQLTLGAAPRAYQRIGAATDYEAIGWPKGARFNGSNTWMQIPALNLSSSDKIVAGASFRKDGDPSTATDIVLIELGAIYTSQGRFVLASSVGGSNNAGFYVRGSSGNTGGATQVLPGTAVTLTGAVDWDATTASRHLRVNGVPVGGTPATGAAAVGGTTQSGDNQTAFIGRRNGAGTAFFGVIYRIDVRTTAFENFLGLMDRWKNEPIRMLT